MKTLRHVATVAALGLSIAMSTSTISDGQEHRRGHGADPDPQPPAHDAHAHHRMPTKPKTAAAHPLTGLRLPDLEVRDHEGRTRTFAELLPQGQVVINFIFTTCTTICPPMGASFGQLQRQLDDRDSEARLISVSVDPTVDTPERLSAWSDRFDRGDRWTLVTGGKREIDRLLKALRVFTPDKIDHAPIVLLGDTRTGQWLRANGLAAPDQLIASLATLTSQPQPQAARVRPEEDE